MHQSVNLWEAARRPYAVVELIVVVIHETESLLAFVLIHCLCSTCMADASCLRLFTKTARVGVACSCHALHGLAFTVEPATQQAGSISLL